MARRNYLPPNALQLRDMPFERAPLPGLHPALMNDPRLLHRLPAPPPPSAAAALLEDRHREIQSLLLDNQRLAATHVALKQELAAAEHELRHLSAASADIKAETDAQLREVYERSLKMETEVRSIDSLNDELAQVRADIQKLSAARQELSVELKAIDGDLVRAHSELQQWDAIKAQIETMHQEIQRGRAAIEYEKEAHASNLEQGEAMEKSMISMDHEIEELRAELANAEKRARAAAAAAAAETPSPGYAAGFRNPEMGYGGSSFPDPYALHQVQGSSEAGSQYSSATAPQGPYDMPWTHVHR
ncbi:protein FLC EXPRESSOR-like [Camellia sinensis]|uniref:Protein FLC EXPRESSOR n=1 Tax=Camellia sinensis var. sinensis TaxID=542762 RepID=A0A4V3WKS1_CAMSN|nr:protein FLC EXPRESSOR-like [Camellia sinensis]THG01937.1 hypothetical protein TEA_006091 [Camellia sinensis var. sinensis]